MDGRQVLRGLLDTVTFAIIVFLVAANTGYMPVAEWQEDAGAGFGVCRSNMCPDSCNVWISYPIGQEPYVAWVYEQCQVTAPNTQWSGFCDGVCGICALGSRCSGVTASSGVACHCISGGC
jgi:hypothetical protein